MQYATKKPLSTAEQEFAAAYRKWRAARTQEEKEEATKELDKVSAKIYGSKC